MSTAECAGVDIGGLAIKITTDDREVIPVPAPDGGPAAAVGAVLAQGAVARAGRCCLAVPDWWLSADPAGAASQEEARQRYEGAAKPGQLSWAGQLAAACAFAVSGADSEPGQRRLLVCDVGGTGVRAGLFSASAGTVRVEAVHAEQGGGWRDFDAAVRAGLPGGQAASLPADWYDQATGAEKRARADMVFRDVAAGGDDDLDTKVYRITTAGGDIPLTARVLTGAFEPTQRRLRAAVAAVLGGRTPPDRIVLAGGLGWFPLAARAAADAAGPGAKAPGTGANGTGARPVTLGVDAAARGALLFASGAARLASPEGLAPVTVPVNRFRNGLLEEISVKLPWTEPYADVPGGPLTIDRSELQVSVAGRPQVVRLPGLVKGRYLIGLRPTWPGPGVLVVRPAEGGAAHIVPLTDLVAR